MPKTCPVCGGQVSRPRGNVVFRCVNPNCPAKKHRFFSHFVSRNAFNIEGLGVKIIEQLLKEGLIDDPADIFYLKKKDLANLERFAQKSAENLIEAIKASKIIDLARFIFALGIHNVGEETALFLAQQFGSLAILQRAGPEELEGIMDIGPVVAKSIYVWFQDKENQRFLEKLKQAGVKVKSQRLGAGGRKLADESFVFTGSLGLMTRDEAKKKVRVFGGKVLTSLSVKTKFLVVGKNPGSKLQKARTLGVKVISEKEFLQMIK